MAKSAPRPPAALPEVPVPVSTSRGPVKGRHNQTDLPGRAPQASRFGLRLCQWVDEGMLLRSPTLAEVSQWLLGRFERRWSQIPWCPDATRWSHLPGRGSGNPPSLLSGMWARSPSVGHISLPPPALCECRHPHLQCRLVLMYGRADVMIPIDTCPEPPRSPKRC